MRWSLAAIALLAASCGSVSRTVSSPHRPAPDYQAAAFYELSGGGSSAPVAMSATPRYLFKVCRANSLLRSICPSRVPSFHGSYQPLGFCYDGHGHDLLSGGHFGRLASSPCVQGAGWGFEAGTGLPGYSDGQQLRLFGWDGGQWLPVSGESLLFSPPLHVHVEIAAIRVSPNTFGWPSASGQPRRVSDALLNPSRREAVSLGSVRWYGRRGELVLAPVFPFGGEWGGHLIFYFNNDGVRYAITLHGWMAALRLSGNGGNRVIRIQPGAAIPHMIATLRSIVGSALRS